MRETVESGICRDALIALTPLQDGMTVAIQEFWEGDWGPWITYGVLRLDVTA